MNCKFVLARECCFSCFWTGKTVVERGGLQANGLLVIQKFIHLYISSV